MTKYQKTFKEMLEYNQKLFDEFKILQNNYQLDPKSWQEKFDEKGTQILRIIRRYENILCANSENSGFGKFSTKLSDKFWQEVRNLLPLIDKVKIV
jgi:hypothetical protein